jgi:hypothetical protein
MRIEGTGAVPGLTPTPGVGPAGGAAAPNTNTQSIAQLVTQQLEEHKGGGGGGGGGGHAKKAMAAIDDIAAKASLRIEKRGKTQAERLADIEKLKAQQKAAAEKVGERPQEDAADEGDESPDERSSPEDEETEG